LNLLNDLKNQSYLPTQVIVGATPIDQLNFSLYNPDNYPLMYSFHQKSQGSCRARNEAIACVKGIILFSSIFVFARFYRESYSACCKPIMFQAAQHENAQRHRTTFFVTVGDHKHPN
jgi:hypothetical protein